MTVSGCGCDGAHATSTSLQDADGDTLTVIRLEGAVTLRATLLPANPIELTFSMI